MVALGQSLASISRSIVELDVAADVMRVREDIEHRYQFSQFPRHDMLTVCVAADDDCRYAAYVCNFGPGPGGCSFLIDHAGKVLCRDSDQSDWRPAGDRQVIDLCHYLSGLYGLMFHHGRGRLAAEALV